MRHRWNKLHAPKHVYLSEKEYEANCQKYTIQEIQKLRQKLIENPELIPRLKCPKPILSLFLLTGMDMLDVDQRFSELRVLQESLTDDATIHALPDSDSPVLHFAKRLDSSIFFSLVVVGCTSNGWYLVFDPNGIYGFMESKWFFAGNG